MDDSTRGYLFRVLHRECSDRPVRLLAWVRVDEFANQVLDLHQKGVALTDSVVLDIMKKYRKTMQEAWPGVKVPYPIDRDNIRASIRCLEHAVAKRHQGSQSEYDSSSVV